MRLSRDAAAGVVVVAFGAAVLAGISGIPTAKYQTIGPDLFPRVCAWALIAGGLVLALRGLHRGGAALALPQFRGVALIGLAVVLFGLVTPVAGYAVGGFLTVLVSGFATREVRPLPLLVVALGLTVFSVALFSYVLKVPMPIGLGL
ncbi:MAG: tripartite tricarboxylate transporter TctB family protein [Alphaproteobacteria bacterium]|nr:tripartite tricarboxylate transporter TctB family protein [Alphaproteobacteria bacterium]